MKNIDRRDFLKRSGAAAIAMSSIGVITGCKNNAHVSTNSDDSLDNSMTYRTNPTTGDKVSILGYGCMRWPMIKDKEGKDIVDQETVNRLVDYALESGVNFFDSSPVYLQGQSETATGIALKRHPRESYFISTKLSNFSNYTRENSIRMYKQSFVNFQTDYLDYYLLHSIKNLEVFNKRFKENGLIDYLVEERKAGRIRNLGFSFHGNKEGFDELMALHETYHWDFVLIQLNYLDWNHASNKNTNASYLQAELDKRGIPSLVMEPLLGGRLANVPDHIAERLKTQNPQGSIASWAFRFAGSQPGVLSVLSGMTYMEHLQDNIKSFSPLKPLTESELEFLEKTAELLSAYPTIPCNDCKYCMPCPYGLDIPAILLHYNKCVNEGLIAKDKEDDNYRKNRRAYLIGYDRAVPQLRQADRCISCGKCTEHCPQHIKIPYEIQRIRKYIENLRRNK